MNSTQSGLGQLGLDQLGANLNLSTQTTFVVSVVIALLAVFLTSFVVQKTLFKGKKRNFIITGPKQSGKTALFYYLTTGEIPELTLSSLEPNTGDLKLHNSEYGENFKDVVLRDYPASPKLKSLYLYPFLDQNTRNCKGIIYVVDASSFSTEYCYRVAEDLLKVLQISESIPNGVDIAVFCNKCDYFTSKKPAKIQSLLEAEITRQYELKLKGLQQVSQPGVADEASETSNANTLEEVLNAAFTDGKFRFEMLEGNVDFLEGNVFKRKTDLLTDWFCEKAAN